MLTSTRPKIKPAPIVPMPAIKNGIDTCSVVFHHSSCLYGGGATFDGFRSNPFSSKWPLSWPFGSSDDAMDVVVIELNEPSDDACLENFSFSLSVYEKIKSKFSAFAKRMDSNKCQLKFIEIN